MRYLEFLQGMDPSMPLKEYHKKRNFKVTAEPYGRAGRRTRGIYMIQKHAASHLHYDFRLELAGFLKSWAIPKGPSLDPHIKRLAVHVEDHPIQYATFQGTIPKGHYGGGTVMLWDQGKWECLDANANLAYKKGNMTIELHGKRLRGKWKLVRTRIPKNWLLIKITDMYARSESDFIITQKYVRSVTTKQPMNEIASHKKPIKKRKKVSA